MANKLYLWIKSKYESLEFPLTVLNWLVTVVVAAYLLVAAFVADGNRQVLVLDRPVMRAQVQDDPVEQACVSRLDGRIVRTQLFRGSTALGRDQRDRSPFAGTVPSTHQMCPGWVSV